jgi:adenine-specific DNA-methyltransferase
MTRRLRICCRYSEDNDVTLLLGDCLTLLQGIPDASAQLIVTSPPYNVGKAYEKRQNLAEYLESQRKVIAECVRITKPGGSICWQVGSHTNGHQQVIPLDILLHPLFAEHMKSGGVRLRNRIVWHFEHGLNCKYRFSGRHETILWYTKGDSYMFKLDAVRVPQKYPGKRAYKGPRKGTFSSNPLGKNPGDVWVFPNVKNNHVEKTIHPCQYPVELPERLILALTNRGDLVVDPFIGVGTTAVAAVLHGRRAAGAETSGAYLKIARRRLRQAALGKLRYRSRLTPVYSPPANTKLTTSPFILVGAGQRTPISQAL